MSRITLSVLTALIATFVVNLALGQDPATATSPAATSADEQAVRQVTQTFAKAFNAGSADQVAAMFLDEAELTDDAGNVHKGNAAIKEVFTHFFAKFPEATSTMTADSVWMVGPTLAIEEGQRFVSTKDGKCCAGSLYALVMTKQKGEWKIAAAREVEDDDVMTPHDRLQPLAWLVGDWVDESSEAVVEISCKWSEDKNFLLVEFIAKVQGKPAMKSDQRIGWDPLTEKVKSWVFDSDGGYGEAQWSQVEDRWVIKSTAVMPDALTGSATITLEPRDNDSYIMRGFDRIHGKVAQPDFEVTIVRRPPTPTK